MLTEGKLKNVALLVALDISLKRMKKSPERCARNILELGLGAYPDKLSKQDRGDLYEKLLSACKEGDTTAARAIFFATFL